MMQPKTKIAALDPICNYFNAIRLIAALQVLYVHVAVNLALPNVPFLRFAEQFPGVPVFFAVSGFLILDSFMRSRSIFDYLTARALRIYPALILNIVVLEIVFAAAGGASFRGAPWRQIAGYETIFALTASDAMGLLLSGLRGGRSGGDFFVQFPSGVLWTLTVELSFYISLLFLGRFAHNRRLATADYVGFAAVSLAYTFEFGGAHENALGAAYFARMSVIPYFWLFAIGMLFRLYVEEAGRQRLLPWVTFSIFAAIAIATGLSLSDWKYHPHWYDPCKMLALGCMTLFLGLSPALRSNWLARNDLSYGIYLWHMLFAHIAISFGYKGAIWTLPATVVLSFGIAWLSMKFIEQPAIAWRKRRSQLRTGITVGTPNLRNYSQSFQS